jgi:7,8-dihydropterin-6-yl-methyl-4-(beta-D-ribofuranosyl)aminobenzene 5'-phosphate synthase
MKLTCLVNDVARPGVGLQEEHGLSFLIETHNEEQALFDAGGSAEALLHNAQALGVDLANLSAMVISHSHGDHTGGMMAVLARRPGLPIYAHPDVTRERFSRRGGEMKSVGLPFDLDELTQKADLRLSADPLEVLSGVWTTGEIVERPEPEGRSAGHFARAGERADGSPRLIPDPYRDDLSLVLMLDQGAALLCGCAHAGLLNILLHVRRTFDQTPSAVIGGTHLISADEAQLTRVIEKLRSMGPPDLYPNHCTGEKAYAALAQAFDNVYPAVAGTVLTF